MDKLVDEVACGKYMSAMIPVVDSRRIDRLGMASLNVLHPALAARTGGEVVDAFAITLRVWLQSQIRPGSLSSSTATTPLLR
ncbi:MAG: hypothetical protein ABI565_11370, partial [Vicinamibacteria bacterium]